MVRPCSSSISQYAGRGAKDKEHAMATTCEASVALIGIDIGKYSLHVVGLDRRGAIVLRQKCWISSYGGGGVFRKTPAPPRDYRQARFIATTAVTSTACYPSALGTAAEASMFIGHYGPAFAGKAVGPAIPLWWHNSEVS